MPPLQHALIVLRVVLDLAIRHVEDGERVVALEVASLRSVIENPETTLPVATRKKQETLQELDDRWKRRAHVVVGAGPESAVLARGSSFEESEHQRPRLLGVESHRELLTMIESI